MRINNNVNAMMAQRNMAVVNAGLSKSLERLSSGLRITNASDDAAGVAISENINTQIRALNTAERNIQDAISFLNARDSALDSLTTIAQRMRELAVQANNTFNSPQTLSGLKSEYDELAAEGSRIVTGANFNGKDFFDITAGASVDVPLTVQVGPHHTNDLTTFTLVSPLWDGVFDPTTPPGSVVHDLSAASGPVAAITALDSLLTDSKDITTAPASTAGLLSERASNGASINRLEISLASLQVYRENLQASFSRIRDTDVAAEMTNLTRQQIILQTSTAMLAQANAQPQSVLALFR